MDFVNETNYKELFLFKCKECDELKEKIKEYAAQFDALRAGMDENDKRIAVLQEDIAACGPKIARLDGMVDAFKYCVRYYMSGEGK